MNFCLCHREAEERRKVSVHRVLSIFQLIQSRENELILSVSIYFYWNTHTGGERNYQVTSS